MGRRHGGLHVFAPAAMAEYVRCFSDPATIHASCEDYRAAESIDLDHDAADAAKKLSCPVLALWGKHGVIEQQFDCLADWRALAREVRARRWTAAITCPRSDPGSRARIGELSGLRRLPKAVTNGVRSGPDSSTMRPKAGFGQTIGIYGKTYS